MPEVKRKTAIVCEVKDILESEYVKNQGWSPNYLKIKGHEVSRVNLIGIIISKSENNYTLEDQSGKINLMLFNQEVKFENYKTGQIVRVIGKPREYDEERFLVPEIMSKINNPKWIEYHQKQLDLRETTTSTTKKPKRKSKSKIPNQTNYSGLITDLIRNLDEGQGVPYEDVLREIEGDDIEQEIKQLINEGELFEIRPGMLKVLD